MAFSLRHTNEFESNRKHKCQHENTKSHCVIQQITRDTCTFMNRCCAQIFISWFKGRGLEKGCLKSSTYHVTPRRVSVRVRGLCQDQNLNWSFPNTPVKRRNCLLRQGLYADIPWAIGSHTFAVAINTKSYAWYESISVYEKSVKGWYFDVGVKTHYLRQIYQQSVSPFLGNRNGLHSYDFGQFYYLLTVELFLLHSLPNHRKHTYICCVLFKIYVFIQ